MHPLGGAVFPFPTPVLPLWCTVFSRTKRFRSRTPLHTWFDQRYGPKPDLTLFGWPPTAGVCPCFIRCARVECALARPAALRLLGPHNSLGCTRRSIQIGCRSIVHRSIDRLTNPMCSESLARSIDRGPNSTNPSHSAVVARCIAEVHRILRCTPRSPHIMHRFQSDQKFCG